MTKLPQVEEAHEVSPFCQSIIKSINGRLENLWCPAPGFRNLTNYVARSLLEIGGFRARLQSEIGRVCKLDLPSPPEGEATGAA